MVDLVETRTVYLDHGRQEIVRILTSRGLAGWSGDDPLAYEKSIVWLRDIRELRYVRTVCVRCARSRRGRLHINSGEYVVGYSKLLPDAPRDPRTACYTRRLFYLKDVDFKRSGASPPPYNAIDPQTILPGILGHPPQCQDEQQVELQFQEAWPFIRHSVCSPPPGT